MEKLVIDYRKSNYLVIIESSIMTDTVEVQLQRDVWSWITKLFDFK
jgi:hypothetical protein